MTHDFRDGAGPVAAHLHRGRGGWVANTATVDDTAFVRRDAEVFGNTRGIEHAEKEAQEIAEGCNRLIRNSIICWNYLYLTRPLEAARAPEARDKILKMIALHSPQAWWYINMLGEYDLSNDKLRDNTGVLPPKSAPSIIPENWEPPKR